MADFSLGDVPIIREMIGQTKEMLSIEHVTVVGNLHWEKMQSLLQALCTQMQAQAEELNNQALRLGKVEGQEKRIADQEKRIADLETELANCKDAMKIYEEERSKDTEKQNQMMDALKLLEDQENRTKSLEAQLASVQDGLAANNLAMRDLNARVSLIEQDLVPLKPLPQRMDALEGTMKKLNAAVANLQQSFRAVDFGRIARLSSMVGKQAPPQEPMPEAHPEPEPVMEVMPLIQPDFSQVEELAANLELLNSKVSKQSEHINDLEAQIEQQNLLIQQLMKSHDADLEALRNSLKALRQEIDSKPLVVPSASPEAPPDTSGLETMIVELQKRLSRKADEDAVNHVASDVQRLKDTLEQMEAAMNILRRRASALAAGGPLTDSMQARLTKAEEDLITMESNKADRSLLDAIELKLSLLGTGDTKDPAAVDTSGLQRLTDLLTKKADRSELLELRKMIQAQASRTSDDDIRRLFEGLEQLKGTKADRSDLSALMLRTPVSDPMDEKRSIRSILNDHALKFTKLDDLLSQLQERLDKKADQASFLFLQDLMESLKQSRKSRTQSFSSGRALQQPFTDEASMLHQMLSELTTTLNDHERILQQLTEGVLIMSGHEEDEEIATGIVSTFRPELDDGISDASESRPSTARNKAATVINRVEPSPTHTSTVNVANSHHESPRQKTGPVVEPVSTPTQEVPSREPVQTAHIVDSKSQQEPTPLYAPETSGPATFSTVTSAPASPSPGPPLVSQPVSYEPSRVAETQEVVRESTGLSQQSPLVESVPAVHPVQSNQEATTVQRLSFTSQQFSVQRSEPREIQPAEVVNPPPQTSEPVRVVDSGIATESRQVISPARAAESRAIAESTQDGTNARFVESREAVPFVEGVVEARPVAVAEIRSNPPLARGAEDTEESRGPSRGPEAEFVQNVPYARAPAFVESRQNARAPEVLQNASPRRVPEVVESRQNGRAPDTTQNSSRQNGRAPDTNQNISRQNGRAPDTTQNSSRQNGRAHATQNSSRQNGRTADTTQDLSRQNMRIPDTAQGRTPGMAQDFSYSLAPDTVQTSVYARTPEVQARAPEIETFSSNRDPDAEIARQIDDILPPGSYVQNFSPAEVSTTSMSSAISPWSNTFTIATSPEARRPGPLDSTYAALEAALKERKIRAKENVRSKDLEGIRMGIEELRRLLSSMQAVKADKHALEELWQFVRTNLTENAMFTGKPLLGFKCMSCEHSLEKLNPFRSDYLPTNMMPKQWLSMFTADRLFNNEKREEKPAQHPTRSPSPPRSIAPWPFPKTSPTGNQEQQQTGGTTPPGNQAGSGALIRPDANQNAVKANVHLGPKVASIPIRK